MGRPERDLDGIFQGILFEKNKVVAGVDDLLQWTLSPRSSPIDLVNDSFNIDSDK